MSKSENESAHIRSDLVDVIEKIFEIKLMNMRTKYKRILLLKHLDEDELFNIFKSEPNVILTLKEVINSGIAFEYLSHYKNPEIRIVDLLRPLENKVFKNEIFLKKFKEEGNTNQLEELVECYEKFIDPLKKSDQPTTLENENERFIHLENDIKEYMKNSPELNGYFLRIKNLLKTDSKQGVLELYIIKWVAVKNSFEKILEKVNEIETSYDIKLPNIKFND